MANYCPIQNLAGISYSCENSMGGIKKVLMASYVEDAYDVDATNGVISGVTSAATFYDYALRKNTSDYGFETQGENGNKSYVTTVNLKFPKMDAAKRLELDKLSKGDILVIVVDNNGKYWALGKDTAASLAVSGGSGTATTDANEFTAVITSESLDIPYPLSDAGISSITLSA